MKIIVPIGHRIQLFDEKSIFITARDATKRVEYDQTELDAWSSFGRENYYSLDINPFTNYCYQCKNDVEYLLRIDNGPMSNDYQIVTLRYLVFLRTGTLQDFR